MFTMCPETLPLPDLAMHSTRTRRDRTGTAIAITILPHTVTATVVTVPVHLPIPPQYARIYLSLVSRSRSSRPRGQERAHLAAGGASAV